MASAAVVSRARRVEFDDLFGVGPRRDRRVGDGTGEMAGEGRLRGAVAMLPSAEKSAL
jgi:hypothetical protein